MILAAPDSWSSPDRSLRGKGYDNSVKAALPSQPTAILPQCGPECGGCERTAAERLTGRAGAAGPGRAAGAAGCRRENSFRSIYSTIWNSILGDNKYLLNINYQSVFTDPPHFSPAMAAAAALFEAAERFSKRQMVKAEGGRGFDQSQGKPELLLEGVSLLSCSSKSFVAESSNYDEMAGSFPQEQCVVGREIEAQDFEKNWYRACIKAVNVTTWEVRVRFAGWNSKWDEWIGITSGRVRMIKHPDAAAIYRDGSPLFTQSLERNARAAKLAKSRSKSREAKGERRAVNLLQKANAALLVNLLDSSIDSEAGDPSLDIAEVHGNTSSPQMLQTTGMLS
eukprot:768014-Hanusia_phi.AAC.3